MIDRSSTGTSTKNSQNKTMHRSGRSESLNFRNHFGGHSVMATVLADTRSALIVLVLSAAVLVIVIVIERFAVHGINATCVTAHKPPFPNERIMLRISLILSFIKFRPEQRVDRDGMIQTLDRSSTSTSTSTSTERLQSRWKVANERVVQSRD